MSLIGNKYEIIRRLGGGSFGEVFLAHHKHLDREEAAKIIKTNNFNNALQEAKTIQKLRHENIIDIYDADILPDRSGIFITMEYHPKGSIANLKFINRRQLVDIAVHILRALEHAHGNEFIHRDIKPNNILFNKHKNAILTDFGLSAKEMLKKIERKAIFRYDWEMNGNYWQAKINNIIVKIEIQRKGNLYNIATLQKRIESTQYRRILRYCFDGKSKSEINNITQKIMSEIDSRFVI